MRIVFADSIDWDFNIDTPYRQPLGGSQSALCYLAEELARAGHEVALLNRTTAPGMVRGVTCVSLHGDWQQAFSPPPDALVYFNAAGWGDRLTPLLARGTRVVLWTQHADDQDAMGALRDRRAHDRYHAIAYVSDWQRQRYEEVFGVAPEKGAVRRNGPAPAFHRLFAPDRPILAEKAAPPVLAYTSTPFRGLHVLLFAFPRIRAAWPGVRLKVFSGMAVYQDAAADADFARLYELCRATAGVDYVGPLAQPDLAREMRSVSVLAYPNTFPETSCIAVIEAMASGARVVTSALAALPETGAGFARLVPYDADPRAFATTFAEAVIAELGDTDPEALERRLRQQVDYVDRQCGWAVRAREWAEWLASIEPR